MASAVEGVGAPTLSDGVVTIRAHRGEDVPRIVEQCRDPESIRWTQVPVPYDEQEAAHFALGLVPDWWAAGTELGFAVDVGGRFAGTVALRDEGDGRFEVAFGAHPDARGTGAMERALRLLLDWGFTHRGAQTVVWRAFVGNWGSRKLAWRLGFTIADGVLRGYLPHRGELRDAWAGTLRIGDPREPRTTWFDVPVLEGDGFRLRPVREEDAPRIHEGTVEPVTAHWLGHKPSPYTPEDAAAYVERRRDMAARGQGVTWAVADADDDHILGTVLFFGYTAGVEAEIGWWLHPDARGRGLVTRAVRLMTDHLFADHGLLRVRALIAAENTASRAVAERLGLTLYGTERYGASVGAGRADMALYDVTAAEWSARRSTENPTASTANPASESAAPTTSGDR